MAHRWKTGSLELLQLFGTDQSPAIEWTEAGVDASFRNIRHRANDSACPHSVDRK